MIPATSGITRVGLAINYSSSRNAASVVLLRKVGKPGLERV